MGLLLKTADTLYGFRFLRLLTTPWVKTSAFKAGIIDDKGTLIRSPETDDERNAYTIFHRLVYNIKRLLNKIPFGKSTIASYMAALYLIKEETGLSDADLSEALYELTGSYADMSYLAEDALLYLDESNNIKSGTYTLLNDIALPKTGAVLAWKNSHIVIKENTKAIGSIFGAGIYPAMHVKTKQQIYVTIHDLGHITL